MHEVIFDGPGKIIFVNIKMLSHGKEISFISIRMFDLFKLLSTNFSLKYQHYESFKLFFI